MSELGPIVKHHAVEAEQQLLGLLLIDNRVYDRIAPRMSADLFYDPVHQRIWSHISARVSREHLASPVTLKSDMEHDEGLQQLGGASYLVRLAGAAIGAYAVNDYVDLLIECRERRALSDALTGAQEALLAENGVEVAKSGLLAVLSDLSGSEGKSHSVSLMSALTGALSGMNDAYGGEGGGLLTGLKAVDDLTGGFWPADLIILGGRPSMGKTAVAVSIAGRVASRGVPVVIVSLEMTEASLAQRLLAERSGVEYARARRGDMSEAEFKRVADKAREMADWPMAIIPPHVREVAGIYAAIRAERARMGGLGLVVIDYLQLVRAAGRDRFQQMTEVSISLKNMAKLLGVPVLCLAQLSRDVERRDDKRPTLSDLRESGQIEQDADVVMFCYRDHYYLSREQPPKKDDARADYEAALAACKNTMDLIVAKQRMGPIGTARVGCAISTNKFWDLEEATKDFD